MIATALRSMPVVVVILILLEIVATNELAGLGNQVRTVDASIDAIIDENMDIEQRLASASSLLTIHEKARELGFTELPRSFTFGPEEFPVAFRQP